jgi:hypothetical protein
LQICYFSLINVDIFMSHWVNAILEVNI